MSLFTCFMFDLTLFEVWRRTLVSSSSFEKLAGTGNQATQVPTWQDRALGAESSAGSRVQEITGLPRTWRESWTWQRAAREIDFEGWHQEVHHICRNTPRFSGVLFRSDGLWACPTKVWIWWEHFHWSKQQDLFTCVGVSQVWGQGLYYQEFAFTSRGTRRTPSRGWFLQSASIGTLASRCLCCGVAWGDHWKQRRCIAGQKAFGCNAGRARPTQLWSYFLPEEWEGLLKGKASLGRCCPNRCKIGCRMGSEGFCRVRAQGPSCSGLWVVH